MLTIKINTQNSAFEGDSLQSETIRILKDIIRRIEEHDDLHHYRTIFDANGNDVGRVKLTRDET